MSKQALPCIACGRALENVEFTTTNQPYAGTAFNSHGHYGSTSYDPMDGHFLEINVCDLCLVTHQDRIMEARDRRPIKEDGVIVGWEDTKEELVPYRFSPKTVDWVVEVARKEFEISLTDEQEEQRAEEII